VQQREETDDSAWTEVGLVANVLEDVEQIVNDLGLP